MKSREAETRNHQKRESDFMLEFDSKPLASPLGTKRDGYRQKWVNVSVRGEPTGKVEDHLRLGYTMVSPERSLSKGIDHRLSRNPLAADHITKKDVVLMEIPEERAHAIMNYQHKKAADALLPVSKSINNGGKDRPNFAGF